MVVAAMGWGMGHGPDTHRQEAKFTSGGIQGKKYPGQEGRNLFSRFCVMLYASWELVKLVNLRVT